jgi:serine/threonine protein kinase
LRTERHDTTLQSDADFLIALAGLSSAVEHVHEFFDRKIDLKLIGCHHDLRPQNVLASGTTLILADFGLSRFKESLRDSDTPFQRGMGDYLAPECEDLETFEPNRIRRSSDIWSFGCILLEAAVYMADGPTAIEDFRNRRLTIVRAFRFHLFHNGPTQPSLAVEDCVSNLEGRSKLSSRLMAALARRMLSTDQSARPKARQTTSRLRFISLSELALTIDGLFSRLILQNDSLDLLLEQTRFAAWKYATWIAALEVEPNHLWQHQYDDCHEYQSMLAGLTAIRDDLEEHLLKDYNACLPFAQLRKLNDDLSTLLPADQQHRSRNFFKIALTNNIDQSLLSNLKDTDRSSVLDRDIRLSMIIRNITELALEGGETDVRERQMNPNTVRIFDRLGEHSIGEFGEGEDRNMVLVEWRRYGSYGVDKSISRQHYGRLNAICKQMSAEQPVSLRALHCRGYYHDGGRHAFGIVFDLPPPTTSEDHRSHYYSLQQWIAETTSKVKTWPVLDLRFRLAYILAKSVLEFHLLGWLHRNLSASNVAFFIDRKDSSNEDAIDPYIIGFSYSRPNDPSAFTSGLTNPVNLAYQHPQYRRAERGYKTQYDYYSLGVVLLEIGHWRPLEEMLGLRTMYGEEHDRRLIDRVSQLKQSMGRDYCEAVRACVCGDFSAGSGEDGGSEALLDFDTKVLSRLHMPSVGRGLS